MHEVSVALAIVEEVTERLREDGAACIATVRLRVGELSCIANDALAFAWDLVTDGTCAAGARLEVERVAVAIYCTSCAGERRPAGNGDLSCAACGTPSAQIVRGRELELVAMEVVDVDTRRGSPTIDPQEEQHARNRPSRTVRA